MSRVFALPGFIALCALVASCATAPPTAAPGLGQSKATAIEVCGPPGQRAYLNQLVCPGGERPTYHRVGSFGSRTARPPPRSDEEAAAQFKRDLSLGARALKPGEPDFHIVDGYEVACSGAKHMIYLDMYHCEQPAPTTPPPGFLFRPLTVKIVSI